MKKEFKFTYDYFNSVDELSPVQQKAIKLAKEALKQAYAPYSNFRVGAALVLEDETYVLGSNQENKAYPSGLCAERVALFSYGAMKNTSEIKVLGIVGGDFMKDEKETFSPCGSCRQVMAEYTDNQKEPFEIVLLNNDGSCVVFESIHHLLPFIFGSPQQSL